MKTNHLLSHQYRQISALLIFILMLIFSTHQISADVTWHESFDEDISSWTFKEGNFEIQDGALVEINCSNIGPYIANGPDMCVGNLWHNSTAMTGSWSIDLLMPSSSSIIFLRFISQGVSVSGGFPQVMYEIRLKGIQHRGIIENAIEFGIFFDAQCDCGNSSLISAPAEFPDDWFRLHFTRDDVGEMKLYIDTELVATFDEVNPLLNTSENIMLGPSIGMKLDNLTYWDEVVDPVPRVNETSSNPSDEGSSTTGRTYIFGAGMIVTSTTAIIAIRKKKN